MYSELILVQIANIVNRVFTEQVFVHRFVHCDPHAGNLKVRKTSHGPQVVLLDNGLYKEYDSDFGYVSYRSLVSTTVYLIIFVAG